MACGATLSLKRSLEFDPLHSPGHKHSPKRRRCMPMTMSPNTPPTKQHQLNQSPFAEISPKLTSEQIAAHLNLEFKRIQRRKQLHYQHGSSPSSSPPPSWASSPSHSQMNLDCAPTPSTSTSSKDFNSLSPNSKKDMPLFTLRQVSLVCERMLKEREDQIKEEYDKVLTTKIAEQYEAFLKFNHDQLHRRFGEAAASYVS